MSERGKSEIGLRRGNVTRPSKQVGSANMAESPKTTIRWDTGMKADCERCAAERGISVAEFIRQAITHYVAWDAATKERES